MTVQSDDGRLIVSRHTDRTALVNTMGLLSEQQVFDALLPLLPPLAPTARQVAEAAVAYATGVPGRDLYDLARRWDEGGRP